jgi:hypothetical protein
VTFVTNVMIATKNTSGTIFFLEVPYRRALTFPRRENALELAARLEDLRPKALPGKGYKCSEPKICQSSGVVYNWK